MGTDSNQIREPSAEARKAGYETSGVSIKGLAIFVVCLVVVAAVLYVGIWFLLGGLLNLAERQDVSRSALTDSSYVARFNREHKTDLRPVVAPPPPTPRIQPSEADDRTAPGSSVPAADLQLMYREEDAVFERMGWLIEPSTHVQRAIPRNVIDAVVSEQAQRSQGGGSPPGKGPGDAGGLGPGGTAPEPH